MTFFYCLNGQARIDAQAADGEAFSEEIGKGNSLLFCLNGGFSISRAGKRIQAVGLQLRPECLRLFACQLGFVHDGLRKSSSRTLKGDIRCTFAFSSSRSSTAGTTASCETYSWRTRNTNCSISRSNSWTGKTATNASARRSAGPRTEPMPYCFRISESRRACRTGSRRGGQPHTADGLVQDALRGHCLRHPAPGASGVRPKASQRKGKKHHRNSVSVRIFQSEPSHQGFFRPIRDLPKAIPDCQAARAPCRSRFMRRAAYMSPPCRFLTYHTPYIRSSSAFPLAKPPPHPVVPRKRDFRKRKHRSGLHDGIASVSHPQRSRDETGFIAGKEGDHRGDFLRFAETLERLQGQKAPIPLASSPVSLAPSCNPGVSVVPGPTALTRILCGIREIAAARVNEATPPLEAW